MPRGDVISQTIPFVGLMDEIRLYHRHYNHIEKVSLDDQQQPECEVIARIQEAIEGRSETRNVVILIEQAKDNVTREVLLEGEPSTYPESIWLQCKSNNLSKNVAVFTTGSEAFAEYTEP